MNYNKPELIELLAAEYVLGTLQGKARTRFMRLMSTHQWIRTTVWNWEVTLNQIAEHSPEVKPSKKLWHKINKAINYSKTPHKTQNSGLWKLWSALSTAALIALITFNGLQTPDSEQHDLMAVVNNQAAQPLWIISADLDKGRIEFQAINAEASALDKAFELWILPADAKQAPTSLGLLPVSKQQTTVNIPAGLKALLENANGLAVSLEPASGSPTGLPTGPVLYQTTVHKL